MNGKPDAESAMTYKRKTWQEKLGDKKELPKVMKLGEQFPCYNAVYKMGSRRFERPTFAV